jgi:hypothetical protein
MDIGYTKSLAPNAFAARIEMLCKRRNTYGTFVSSREIRPVCISDEIYGLRIMLKHHPIRALYLRHDVASEVATQQGSIVAVFKGTDGKAFYPLHLWGGNERAISLSFRWLKSRPALASEEARARMMADLVAIVGPLTTTNIAGFPSFKPERLADRERAAEVRAWFSDALKLMK